MRASVTLWLSHRCVSSSIHIIGLFTRRCGVTDCLSLSLSCSRSMAIVTNHACAFTRYVCARYAALVSHLSLAPYKESVTTRAVCRNHAISDILITYSTGPDRKSAPMTPSFAEILCNALKAKYRYTDIANIIENTVHQQLHTSEDQIIRHSGKLYRQTPFLVSSLRGHVYH